MNRYYAQLEAHCDVPEQRSLELDLNYSIRFPIFCPIDRCKSIKKNGFDRRHSQEPQWFKCKIHENSFYAHTSWTVVQLTQVIIIRILTMLFAGKKPANSLAAEYRINESTISKIIHQSKEYVVSVVETIKKLQMQAMEISTDNTGIIWLDEIFFKAGKVSFPLILAINNDYQIVGWKLGKTRNGDDVLDVLKQVDKVQSGMFLLQMGAEPIQRLFVNVARIVISYVIYTVIPGNILRSISLKFYPTEA